jgi:hypothetical protein
VLHGGGIPELVSMRVVLVHRRNDPTEAALAAGLHIEEFEGVSFFWYAPEGYIQALLSAAQPAIAKGCLVVAELVPVW